MSKRRNSNPADSFIKLRGCFNIDLRDADGNVLDSRKALNTVTTRGRREVLDIIRTGGSTNLFGWMAIGTGTSSAPSTADTLLQNEYTRKAIGTFTTTNLTSSTPSWDAISSWATNEGNTTVGEVGLFNSSGAATQTLLARATFSTINKTTSNTLTITYTISN